MVVTNLTVAAVNTDWYTFFVAQPTNTRFSVAVHLLALLADLPGEMVDSRTLAISPASSPVHVRRVLGQLRNKGLVRSQPGAHGGWELARPPEQIDLGEVWQAVNGDDPVLGLHVPDPNCPTGLLVSSNLRALDRRAFEVLVDELAQATVADVLADMVAARVSP